MFDTEDPGPGDDWTPDPSGMPDWFVPDEAWATAPSDGDGHSSPEWLITEGTAAVVHTDAVRPADAWGQAADYLQARLPAVDAVLRQAVLDRIDLLVGALEASMMDMRLRFGMHDTRIETDGLRAFAKQTALELGETPHRILHELDTADTATRLLPQTWAVFRALACPWRALELAVAETDGLPPEVLAAFDAAAAELVVSSPLSRLKGALRKKRERLQDDTAKARAKRTAEKRTVRFHPGRDGAGSLTFTGPVAELSAIDRALTKAAVAAKTEDDTRTITQLRYDVGLDLAIEGLQTAADPDSATVKVPARRGVEVVAAVTIPALAWLGLTREQATLEGVGPIALETGLRLAATAPSLLRILTDPITGVRLAMDRTTYRPPADLARWVTYRDQRCRFPGCNRAATLCDIDHAIECGVVD